jgi:SRSO17 transposase
MQEEFNLFPTGQALEALCAWSDNLKSFQQRIGKYFARFEAKGAAFDYIQALLCPVERKNGWQMAEQVGYANPYRLQHLLGRAIWDEEQVCAEVRDYVVEHLDDGAGILAVDETSFLKKGEESVGVGRQYCGLTGQIENCQVGVFLAYISSKGQSLIDRRLYLPKSWTTVSKRRKKTHIPRQVRFATKTGLAKEMLQSAINAGICPAWFVADEVYSRDASFWRWLEQTARQPYVLTVNKRQPTPINFQTCYAEDLVRTVPPDGWQRLSTGAGTKGERYYDWARVKLNCRHPEGFSRWFLFRRCPERPDGPSFISYYQVFAPSDTSLETIVGVAGQRWRIEECFQFTKDQLGLGDYEVRSWTGWHRHITLVLAAGAFLSVLRYQAEPLGELSTAPFFSPQVGVGSLVAFKAVRGLSSASVLPS